MNSTADPAFEAWLAAVAKQTDRNWVRHNLPALRKAYDANPGVQFVCPPPPDRRARDRYEEL